VANLNLKNVSVIDGATNKDIKTVGVGIFPDAIAVDSANGLIYVANAGSNTLSVIDGATNTVIKTINL